MKRYENTKKHSVALKQHHAFMENILSKVGKFELM